MSMVKTLKQIGNSYGVIIDKPILEILHITPETPLEITTDGQSLQIRPVRPRKRPALNESLAVVNKRHASDLPPKEGRSDRMTPGGATCIVDAFGICLALRR